MITKCVQIDGWIFEVKAVRALQVECYGQPYTAIANINIAGDSAYIDGIISKDNQAIIKDELTPVVEFCRQLKLSAVEVDFFQQGQRVIEHFSFEPNAHFTPLAIAHSG